MKIKKKHLEKNEFIKDNRLTLRIQQILKSESFNVFTKEINKNLFLSSNDEKRMNSIDSIETYPYGNRKYLVIEKK